MRRVVFLIYPGLSCVIFVEICFHLNLSQEFWQNVCSYGKTLICFMPQLRPNDILFCNAVLKLELLTKDYMALLLREWIDSTESDCTDFGAGLVSKGAINEKQRQMLLKIVEHAPSFVTAHAFLNEQGEFVKVFDKNASHTSAAMQSTSGSILRKGDYANYAIVDLIGSGGLGCVMRGVDRSLSRDIAVKELHTRKRHASSSAAGNDDVAPLSEDEQRREMLRFLNEALITGQLQHPGIVPIYRLGLNHEGMLFYAMKYVKGRPLELNLDNARGLDDPLFSFQKRLLQLVPLIEVCNAVAFAHSKGVIHRDLKPENIVVGPHGEAVILDWGLAKKLNLQDGDLDPDSALKRKTHANADRDELLGVVDSDNLSVDGEVLGSPAYIAPETLSSLAGTVGPQTDVYALGTILYQILTGRLPYDYETTDHLLQQKANLRPPVGPSVLNSHCPPELEAICLKAIAVRASDRYRDAGALADELRAYQDGKLVKSYNYSVFERLRVRMARHRKTSGALIFMGLILSVSVLFGVYYGLQAHSSALDAERKQREAVVANQWSERMGKSMRQALEELPEIQNECLTRSLMVTQSFRAFFTNLDSNMQLSAREISGRDAWTTESLSGTLKKVMGYEMLMQDAIVVDKAGKVVGAYPSKYDYLVGMDFSARRHVQRVLTDGTAVLSALYQSEERDPAFSYCVPVFRGGAVVGSMNAFFKAHDVFAKLLDTKRWGGNASFFRVRLLQADGVLMYDSHNEPMIGHNMISVEQDRERPYRTGFFRRVLTNEMGVGKYIRETENFAKHPNLSELQEHEVCAWQTYRLDQTVWKVVVSIVFKEGEGIIPPYPAQPVRN